MPHMDLPPCLSTDETREGRERGDRATESPARARTVLCPRRHRRDLSPPFRPPEAETHPPNASMNVFLVDSPTRESWRCCIPSFAPQARTIPSSLPVLVYASVSTRATSLSSSADALDPSVPVD